MEYMPVKEDTRISEKLSTDTVLLFVVLKNVFE